MGNGDRGRDVRTAAAHPSARWLLLVAVVGVAGIVAWRTASFGTAIELVAVLTVLLGVGVAFGAAETRPRRGSSLVPPGRRIPDQRLAAQAESTLSSFDCIEHRRLEVGSPWPQLLVGPSGAVVIDLCPVDTKVELDRSGVRDRGEGRGRPCSSCQEARRLAATVRASLDEHGIDLPVRTVAVVSDDTTIVVAPDAPEDVTVVAVDRLADALARGPVLPMQTVDAAFEQLTRTIATEPTSAT